MTSLEDDEVRDGVLEIKDRIAEEHHRGGHVTGYVAGCSICAELRAAAERPALAPVPSLPTSLEDLARLRVLNPPPPGTVTGQPSDFEAPREIRVHGGFARPDGFIPIARSSDDEPSSLIEMALEAGEQALTEAANGRHSAATVTATVGVIRAVAAIDDTLRTILAAIVNQQLDAGIRASEQLDAERPERPSEEAQDALEERALLRAARMKREDAPDGAA